MVTRDRAPPGWGCPTVIAPQLRTPGADSGLTVTANPKHRQGRREDTCASAPSQGLADCPHDSTAPAGQDQGRIATRRCGVMGALDYRQYGDPEQVWTDLQSLIMVESERRCGTQVATQVRCFISRLPPRPPRCCPRCGTMGASKTPCTGSWMWPAGKMPAASVGRRTRIPWPLGGAAPGMSCHRRQSPVWAWPTSASRPPGT